MRAPYRRKCPASAAGDYTYDDLTSRQVSAMISVREGVDWLTPLPMTRRHDAVGSANWLAEGGADARVVARRSTPDRDCGAFGVHLIDDERRQLRI